MLTETQGVADPAATAPAQSGLVRMSADMREKIDGMETFITKDLREMGKPDSILNSVPKHLTDMFAEWDSADKTPEERKLYEEMKSSILEATELRAETVRSKFETESVKMDLTNAIKGIQKGVQGVNTLLTQPT